MKIRVSQYSGSDVTNSPTIQYIKLDDPEISEFDTFKITGATAAYEATVGEYITYSKFTVVYDYNVKLKWSGLQFHKLSDDSWVTRLKEDQFLADEYYYSLSNSNGDSIALFGTSEDQQLDLSNSDDFKHSKIAVYEEAFCNIEDVKRRLLSPQVAGRITIGETESKGDDNTIDYLTIYELIREVWADMSMNLSKRYALPIRIQSSVTEIYLRSIASKKVAYEIYVTLFPIAKYGEVPDGIEKWRSDYYQFEEDIMSKRLDGVSNILDSSGGVYEVERG